LYQCNWTTFDGMSGATGRFSASNSRPSSVMLPLMRFVAGIAEFELVHPLHAHAALVVTAEPRLLQHYCPIEQLHAFRGAGAAAGVERRFAGSMLSVQNQAPATKIIKVASSIIGMSMAEARG